MVALPFSMLTRHLQPQPSQTTTWLPLNKRTSCSAQKQPSGNTATKKKRELREMKTEHRHLN
jgi:hypothetical protein